ncbi:MAG: T9SS type A sorting domain-containing protein [Bacteroidales bacterium]|nr:T9SS type A sorting domain-containing protein [Bacteroidales bacterium]
MEDLSRGIKKFKTAKIVKETCLCIIMFFTSNQVFSQPDFGIAGFATQNGGTTGGLGGDTVTVNNYSDFKSYAESTTKYVIMIEGEITNGAGGGQVNMQSDKTIRGMGNDAFLHGIGLAIGSANNIIIQNIKITMVGLTTPTNTNDGDCISVFGSSKNIWIDHCELYSENPDVQTDKDKYDGLIDIKQQTGFITISWCYLHDHWKCGLVGAADDDLHDDRKVTFHHNYYNNVKLRMPMYRGSVGHFFNNYLIGAKDATEIRANTCVRVERNYYESLHYSIYTPSDSPGKTQRIGNIEVERTTRPYPVNCIADIPYDYTHFLTINTEVVKTLVPKYAGVGIIDSIQGNPPSVVITYPENNDILYNNSDIIITADAIDDDSVTSVEFFNGNKSLGIDEEPPFSVSISNADTGTYNITAVATDNDWGISTSTKVTFTVEEDPSNSIIMNGHTEQNFLIYPVPVENMLHIELIRDVLGTVYFRLYDLTGKEVISTSFNNRKLSVDITELKTGLYIIKVWRSDINSTIPIVKL